MRQMEFCFLWNIYWEWKSFFSSLVAFCCRNCLWLGNLAGVTLSTWSFWPNLMADLTGTDPHVILLFQKLNIGVFLLHQQVSGNIITFLFITFAVSWRAWCWDPAVLSSGWAIQQMLQERLSFFYTRCMPGFKKLKYQGVQYPLLSEQWHLSWLKQPIHESISLTRQQRDPSPALCSAHISAFLSEPVFQPSCCPAGALARKLCRRYTGGPQLEIAYTASNSSLGCLCIRFCVLIQLSACSLSDYFGLAMD